MKRNTLRLLPLLLALGLILTACGPKDEPTPDAGTLAQTILDSGAFTDTLEALDVDKETLCQLYGLDSELVESALAYTALSMGAEELTLFTMKDIKNVPDAMEALVNRVDDQKTALEAYQPQEMPKLDAALITDRGRCAILVVAGQPDTAREALDIGK